MARVKINGPDVPTIVLGKGQDRPPIIVKKPSIGQLITPVRGPAGPRGEAGGNVFEHVQSVAQTTWTIDHDLGRDPVAIQVFDASDVLVSEWSLQFTVPDSQIRLGYDIPFSGRARLI